MENVRPLSTSEMGGMRYRAACEAKRFPVEFAYKEKSADAAAGEVALKCSWLEDEEGPLPQLKASEKARKGDRAAHLIMDVPLGEHSVEFVRGEEVLLRNSFVVKVTDMPNTQKAQKRFSIRDVNLDDVNAAGADDAADEDAARLKSAARAPPGVRMVASGRIAIIFNEIAWARSVKVRGKLPSKSAQTEAEESADPDGDVEFSLEKSDGREWRVELDHVTSGSYWFRFEVVLGEATTASSAPMTEFGWDRARSSSHTLISPKLEFEVRSGEPMTGDAVCSDELQEFKEVEDAEDTKKSHSSVKQGEQNDVHEQTKDVSASNIRAMFERDESVKQSDLDMKLADEPAAEAKDPSPESAISALLDSEPADSQQPESQSESPPAEQNQKLETSEAQVSSASDKQEQPKVDTEKKTTDVTNAPNSSAPLPAVDTKSTPQQDEDRDITPAEPKPERKNVPKGSAASNSAAKPHAAPNTQPANSVAGPLAPTDAREKGGAGKHGGDMGITARHAVIAAASLAVGVVLLYFKRSRPTAVGQDRPNPWI